MLQEHDLYLRGLATLFSYCQKRPFALCGKVFTIWLFSLMPFTATWAQSASPFAHITLTQHVCGQSLGAITVELNGDPSSYTYYWLHGPTELHLENLQPGIYTLVVINEFGCVEEYPVEILEEDNCYMEVVISNTNKPCYKLITIYVYQANGTPIPASSLNVVWQDGDPSGLVRVVPAQLPSLYCVSISTITSGGQAPCCQLEQCIGVEADPKCNVKNLREVIVNEFARDAQGGGQFVELLVVGSGECNDTFDMRGFIVDDNNGYLIPGNDFVTPYNLGGIGVDPGYLAFLDVPTWSNVPVGSLIVVYPRSGAGTDGMPAEDPTDADSNGVYVVFAENADFLTARSGTWDSSDKLLEYDGYLLSPSWDVVQVGSGADGMQVRYPDGEFSHGVSLGSTAFSTANDFPLWITNDYYNKCDCRFHGTDYLDKTHFLCGTEGGPPTPGAPNSEDNEAFIAQLHDCVGLRSDGNALAEKKDVGEDNSLTVYPNPFSNQFTLDFTTHKAGGVQVSIFSVSGHRQLTESWECKEGASTYLLKTNETLPPGVFILKFTFPDRTSMNVRIVRIR